MAKITFERGSIYRAIRDVLTRKLIEKGIKVNAYSIATNLVKKGYRPQTKKEAKEILIEYQSQINMLKNPYNNDKYDIIGRQVKAIEYYDVIKAKKEKVKNPFMIWRHDFKVRDAVIYGLTDGSILIKSKSGKKLWDYR